MFTFDPETVKSESNWQTVTIGQAMCLFKEATGVSSLGYVRDILRYNLGDGHLFSTRLIARLIREWHEQNPDK